MAGSKQQNGARSRKNKANGKVNEKEDGKEFQNWGRAWETSLATNLGCAFIVFVCPVMPLLFIKSCTQDDCSLVTSVTSVINAEDLKSELLKFLPPLSLYAAKLYGVWFALQVFLYNIPDICHKIIPNYVGGYQDGQLTPAGKLLNYNINGLQAWIITHILWAANAFHFHWFSPAIIFDNWIQFLAVVNIGGYLLSFFAYFKGLLFPNDPEDCKVSGSVVFDFLMGVEFNPRIGQYFDFKLFFNGRPGICCWTVINLSFAWHQLEAYGHVTDSMILLNFLHAMYVVDYFWNERWYLKTIDICHDHFGFMLGWGDLVWLPYMYTLQGLYLAYHPVVLGTPMTLAVLSLGLFGFYIFRATNAQKDLFRRLRDNAKIWGKKPEYISCWYLSSDGKKHDSTLLVSGWWGVTRHMNYTGDLMGSLAYCLCCGFTHILPYFYIIYMTILLVHRIYRDEHRCSAKYGKFWKQYTDRVRYRLVPGIY